MDVKGVAGFLHAVVSVPDLERVAGFLPRPVGRSGQLRVGEHDPVTLGCLTGYEAPSAHAAVVSYPDGSEIELCEFRRPRGVPTVTREWYDAGVNFVTFRGTDIHETVEKLESAGTRLHTDIVSQVLNDGEIAEVVYCFAPEGTPITLVQLPGGRRSLASPDA